MRVKPRQSAVLFFLAAIFLSGGACRAGGLTAASAFPSSSEIDAWTADFANCVSERIGAPVEVYSGGKLGDATDLVGAIQKGSIDFAVIPVASLASSWNALGLLTVPGAVSTPDEILRVSRNREFTTFLDKMNAGSGFHIVGLGWQYQTLVGDRRLVGRPAGWNVDLTNVAAADVFSRLGATPLHLPTSDVPTALSVGLIDGAVLDVDATAWFVKEGLTPSVTWSDDYTPLVTPVAIVLSDKTSRNWGEEFLRGIREKCAEVTNLFNEEALKIAMDDIYRLKDAGVNVEGYDLSVWSQVLSEAYKDAVVKLGAEEFARALDSAKR